MSIIRATNYLKSSSGARPFRSCYFNEAEYQRLMKDFTGYEETGNPQSGSYGAAISGNAEQIVALRFGEVAEIRTNQQIKE